MKKAYRTILAFDFGTRRIGVAVGQGITRTASALTVLKANDGIPSWDRLGKLIKEWQPDHILVGLPLNMDGTESDFCLRARKFARRLHGRYGVSASMVDERLTTFEARQNQGPTGSYRENPVDSEAARIMLSSWLESSGQEIPL